MDKMSAAYSEHLWWKIVFHHFLYGHYPDSIARQLIISRLTVLRILKLYRDTGNVYKSYIIPGRALKWSCKCSVAPRCFPRGGVLHQIFGTHNKKWTQSDLTFCENEVSKRFKITEKGAQLDRKLREHLYKML